MHGKSHPLLVLCHVLVQVLNGGRAFHFAEYVVVVEQDVAVGEAPEPGLDPLAVGRVGEDQIVVTPSLVRLPADDGHVVQKQAVAVQDKSAQGVAGAQGRHVGSAYLLQERLRPPPAHPQQTQVAVV